VVDWLDSRQWLLVGRMYQQRPNGYRPILVQIVLAEAVVSDNTVYSSVVERRSLTGELSLAFTE